MNKGFQHLKGTPYMFNIDCGDPIFYVNVNVVNPIKNQGFSFSVLSSV